ncbi:hypothetical protein D187_002073 [Cystobacter fuscus DSM 2262]|uniref:AMIN-like domain-containing protein n=1 Tax=Cystobacter fuscus (strain ATCC 25194 / DSM 2262 / NBRC 100088 / M29) TaxID=1242864 RepID=S9PCH7_CYSF2|nr:hypothetical protein [Cystobacter fuscus]EPX59987.1 hypothetical protein D187_002073 [Cystobacter fuscus DSM 2262]
MKRRGCSLSAVGLAACLTLVGCKEAAPPAPATPPAKAQTPPSPTTPPPDAPTPAAEPTSAPPPSTPSPATPPPAKEPEWIQAKTNVPRSGQKAATLREVRAARNEGFDRVVFQFDGETLPGYRVEYLDGPAIRCGSGDPTEVAGQGRLQVSLQPAQAHDENGQVTIASRERTAALPVLQELEQTCDFEGEVTWVLGVKQPQAYRVLELHAPTRIVVDVRY